MPKRTTHLLRMISLTALVLLIGSILLWRAVIYFEDRQIEIAAVGQSEPRIYPPSAGVTKIVSTAAAIHGGFSIQEFQEFSRRMDGQGTVLIPNHSYCRIIKDSKVSCTGPGSESHLLLIRITTGKLRGTKGWICQKYLVYPMYLP